jgi:hypothetical protein
MVNRILAMLAVGIVMDGKLRRVVNFANGMQGRTTEKNWAVMIVRRGRIYDE